MVPAPSRNIDHQATQEAVALVAAFEALDASFFTELRAGNAEVIFTVRDSKQKVKEFLAKHPAFRASGILASKLKNIRDNVGYNIDKFYNMVNEGEENPFFAQEDVGDRDFIEALFKEGTASYVDHGFFRRRAQVGTLIVPQHLPDHLLGHVERVKECYSLGLGVATIVFCRSVIEAAVFEALRRRGQLRTDPGVIDHAEFSLKLLMQRIREWLPPQIHADAVEVIRNANSLLHSQQTDPDSVRALVAIKSTFRLVETLFQ